MTDINIKGNIDPMRISAYLRGGETAVREVRREYTRQRDIASKRLARLSNSEFADSEFTNKYQQGFPKLSDIGGNKRELAHALADVNRFLNSKGSTIKGQTKMRDERIATLHAHGYDFVTKENYKEFTQLMSRASEMGLSKAFGSDTVAELVKKLPENSNNAQIEKALRDFTQVRLFSKNLSKAKAKRRKMEIERQRKASKASGVTPKANKPKKKKKKR